MSVWFTSYYYNDTHHVSTINTPTSHTTKLIVYGRYVLDIKEIKSEFGESSWKFLILNVVTAGFYMLLWFEKRRNSVTKLAGRELYTFKHVTIMTCVVGIKILVSQLAAELESASQGATALNITAQGLSWGIWVLMAVVAWKGAEFLESYIKEKHEQTIKLNRIWVVILSVYYINCLTSAQSGPKELKS
jgi:hypothetical protein